MPLTVSRGSLGFLVVPAFAVVLGVAAGTLAGLAVTLLRGRGGLTIATALAAPVLGWAAVIALAWTALASSGPALDPWIVFAVLASVQLLSTAAFVVVTAVRQPSLASRASGE